jgi:hypothetical protein
VRGCWSVFGWVCRGQFHNISRRLGGLQGVSRVLLNLTSSYFSQTAPV